jgi:hypothetical protein
MGLGVTLSFIPRRHFKQKKNGFLRKSSENDLRTSAEVSKLLEPNPEVGKIPSSSQNKPIPGEILGIYGKITRKYVTFF